MQVSGMPTCSILWARGESGCCDSPERPYPETGRCHTGSRRVTAEPGSLSQGMWHPGDPARPLPPAKLSPPAASPSLPGPNGGVQRPARRAPRIEPRPRCDAPGAARRRRGGARLHQPPRGGCSAVPPPRPGTCPWKITASPPAPPPGRAASLPAAPPPVPGHRAGWPRAAPAPGEQQMPDRPASHCRYPDAGAAPGTDHGAPTAAGPHRLPRPHRFHQPDRRSQPRKARSPALAQSQAPIAVLPLPPGRTEQPMPEVRALTVPMPPPGPSRRTG